MTFALALAATHAILAEASPSAEQTGNWVLIFVAVCVPVVSLAISALGAWVSARRNPPLAEEFNKLLANYVPRTEHDEEVIRLHDRVEKVDADRVADTNALRALVSKVFGDTERAIGRLEGKLDGLEPPQRRHHH